MFEICHICTYDEHNGHPIVPLGKKLEEYKQVIEGNLPTVRNNLKQLSDQKRMLEGIRDGVKQNEDSAMQQLQRRVEAITMMLKQYQQEITIKIKTESEQQQGKVNTILKSVDSEILQCQKLFRVGDHLNKIPVSSALQVAKEFIASSRQIQPVPPMEETKVKAESPGLSFNPPYLTFKQLHPTFASMMGEFHTPAWSVNFHLISQTP